ncbi:MAG: HAD family phosphatase [Clostridia bacterium]|nr:HAD family phosphatase [Clostridia bacterium]
MNKQIIMFDFDNTLVSSLKYWHRVLDKELFKKYGKKVDKRMATLRVGTTNREMAEIFIKLADVDASYEEISSGWNDLMEQYYTTKIKPIKCAKEYLTHLKNQGKTLVLATATQDDLIQKALDHFDLNVFDYILTEKNLDAPKYKTTFFERAVKKLNTNISNIIFFEDSFGSIKSATSLGIECNALIHKYNKKNKKELEKICAKTLKNYKKLAK